MANIFASFAQPVRSVSDYMGDYQQQEGNKLALAAKRMQIQQAEQGAADEQAARTAYMQSGGDSTKYRNALTQLGNYKGVQALDAADLAAQKSRGEIGKLGAETDDKRMATAQKRIETAGQVFGFVKDNPTADNAIAAAQHLGEQGIWDAATVAKAVQSIQANPTPENVRNLATQAYQNALSAKDQLPQLFNQNRGGTFGVKSVNPVTGAAKDVSVDAITQSADNAASNARAAAEGAANRGVQMRGQNLSDARARETLAQGNKAPAGYRYKPDGSMEAIPGGPADLKNTAGTAAKVTDAQDVLSLLDQAEPLIGKATNSYAGAGIDQLARVVGGAPDGAKAAAQLRTLEGALIAKMPKMSGPQSDKDVLLYKQMAGQIGDNTIPAEQKRAAMQTIREINERHAGGGKSQRIVVRSGTSNGRKVAEYSDGTIAYVD